MRVGERGRIASGREQGRYVRVQDDQSRTGGFLILTAADPDLTVEGADCWVENRLALERFAQESNWVIEWEGGESGAAS
jgi:hypothetical protein